MTNVSRRELSVLALRSPRVAAKLLAKFSGLFFSRFGDGEEAETRAFAFSEKEGLDLVLDADACFDEALDSFVLPSCPSAPGEFAFDRSEFFSGIGASIREMATFLGFDRARVLREIGEATLEEALLDDAISAKANRDRTVARGGRERLRVEEAKDALDAAKAGTETVAARLALADLNAEVAARVRLAEIEKELDRLASAGAGFASGRLLAERAKIVSDLRLFALRK